MGSLDGKVAWVTGAGSGMGLSGTQQLRNHVTIT